MEDVDWEMMEQWIREGSKRASGVTLQTFGDVPDDIIEEHVELCAEMMNQQPLGEIESRARITPELRRQTEAQMREGGQEWTTIISREADGTISGLTEVFFQPEEAHRITQGITGVKNE